MTDFTDEQRRLAQLLARIALRDRRAFEQLYLLVNSKLNGVALTIAGQQAAADDILQEAFMQIWHNAGSYHDDLGTPLVWMRSIVRYRAFDHISKRKRFRSLDGVVADGDAATPASSSDLAAVMADRQILDRCLDTLQESSRESILLAYLFGYSREEIAERLLTPLNTIKSWLKRGLERLEQCLRQNAI